MLTFSMKDVLIMETLSFINCTFESTEEVSYGASFAMIETRQAWNPDDYRFFGELIFDGLVFTQGVESSEWDVLTLDMLRTTNVVIKNSAVSSTSSFAFYRAYNVSIVDSTFEDSGATFIASSHISVSDTKVTGRPVADYLLGNTEAFFVFIESDPGLPDATAHFYRVNFENITRDPNESEFPLEGGIISVPTTQSSIFSTFNVSFCSFNNVGPGIYAIKSADDRQEIFARSNWWGSSDGPTDRCNSGHGAEVYWNRNTRESHVKYSPWCSNPACQQVSSGSPKLCLTKPQLLSVMIGAIVLSILLVAIIIIVIYCCCRVRHAASFQRVTCIPRAAVELMSPKDIGVLEIPYSTFNPTPKPFTHGGRGDIEQSTIPEAFAKLHLDSDTSIDVVIKFPRLTYVDKAGAIQPLSEEAKEANRRSLCWELYLLHCFNHHTFPELLGYTREKGEYGIVMKRMTRFEPLKPTDPHGIVMLVAKALQFLHSHRIIHGDLKPGNLLYSDEEKKHVVIADLGDSYFIRNDLATMSTPYFGTQGYACPKRAKELSMAADIYSFGKTVFAIYSGLEPKDEYFTAVLTAPATHVIAQSAPKEAKAIAGWIQTIISSCLRTDPAMRPTIAKVIKALSKPSRSSSHDVPETRSTESEEKRPLLTPSQKPASKGPPSHKSTNRASNTPQFVDSELPTRDPSTTAFRRSSIQNELYELEGPNSKA